MSRLVSFLPSLSLLSFLLLGCSSPAEVGLPCSDSADCVEGHACFFTSTAMTESLCMTECDDATVRLCGGGEVCIPTTDAAGVPREAEICFLGGTTPVGTACTSALDCERGAICVITGTAQTCARACSTDDGAACQATETCEALAGMDTKGFCAATP